MKSVRGVFERDRGSGVYWIRWADGIGQIHREKVGPRELALAAYQKRKTEVREGRLFPAVRERRLTFGEMVDDFKRAKPNHWAGGKLDIVRAWFSDLPCIGIGPQKIQEKLNKLERDGLAAATLNRYRSIIGAVFSWAVRNGRIEKSPVRSVPMRREQNQRIRFLESEEEARLRDAILAIAPDREPEFTLALHTGIRQGELLTLTWDDVDLERGVIHLKRTKSGRSRGVPINRDAVAALKKLRAERRKGRVSAGNPRSWFEAAVREAEIPNFRWHDLRHTFASRLVMAGVNLRTVQELLGHQTIAMTLRYSHLSPAHLKEAVDAICSRPETLGTTQHKRPGPTGTATDTGISGKIAVSG